MDDIDAVERGEGKGWKQRLVNHCRIRKSLCRLFTKNICPLGSVVEHSLHTRGVNGSNPLAGTNILSNITGDPFDHWVARFVLHTPSADFESKTINAHKIDLLTNENPV